MYWLREYSLPTLLAIALHALAAWSLYSGWTPDKDVMNVIKPPTVMANLLVLEPKAKPAPPPKPAAAQSQPIAKAAPPKPDPKIAQRKLAEQKAAEQAAEEAAKRAAEQEAAKRAAEEQARQERLARLSELAQSSFTEALSQESASLEAANAETVAQSYRLGIYEIVRQNWSRPPSARNGMSAKLLVELIPTGEVVGVSVVESSGNPAFDRSAEQAVRRARRFEVPTDNSVFEAHFRQFYFLFQPEDLLR